MLQSIVTGPFVESWNTEPRYTVRDVCARHLEHARYVYRRPDGTPTKTPVNIELATRTLIERYGDVDAERLDSSHLKAVRSTWVTAGLCRTTINDRINYIGQVWAWGAEFGLVTDEAVARVRAVRPLRRGQAAEGPGVDPVPLNRVLRSLPAMPTHVAAMVRFMLLTSCRVGEAREARSDELERGKLWILKPQWHKNARHGLTREILLNDTARELVRPRLHRRFLFGPGDGSHPYHRDAVTTAIYRACDKAGVQRWSPGQIRHLCAHRVLREHGLEHTRAILGHTTDRVTRRYAGAGEGPQLVEAADTLARIA